MPHALAIALSRRPHPAAARMLTARLVRLALVVRSARVALLAAAVVLLGAPSAQAHHGEQRLQSWQYLTDKLVADGIPRRDVERAFRDRRVGTFDGVDYALIVRESARSYRDFRSRNSLHAAARCRTRYDSHFRRAEREFGVDADVLAAILYVETRCGLYTGNRVVLRQLARLAMASEPRNVAKNIRRHKREDEEGFTPAEIEKIARERATYLHETFYPEVVATFQLARKVGFNPAGMRGSPAGAFGLPQFLPSSYLRFAQDGNRNGRTSLFEAPDAIHSAARFLQGHGWQGGMGEADRRRVIWHYNRSDPYIDTILLVAAKIPQHRR